MNRPVTNAPRRVFVIGLDAAEWTLLDAWMRAGELPALRGLMERGSFGRLDSIADCFPAAVWPCLGYGTGPARNLMYSVFPLAGDGGEITTLRRVPLLDRPFMAYGPQPRPRTVLVDIPKLRCDPEADAIQVASWGAHAPEGPFATHPPELAAEILQVVGTYPLRPLEEEHHDQSDAYFFDLHQKLLVGIERRRQLVSHLMQRHADWELFVAVWSEPHAAGHRFWHFSDPTHPWYRADAPEQLRNALLDVQRTIDRAIAELLAELPPETVVLVTAMHGIAANCNAHEPLVQLMHRWFAPPHPPASGKARLAEAAARLRRLAPAPLRDTVKHWLPDNLRFDARMMAMKSLFDASSWGSMRAYCLPSDDNGYIRVNLHGRDDPGLVMPGAEYEALLDEVTEELLTLRNIDSDEPVIASISRPQERFEGPYRDRLPDLTLHWNDAGPVRGVRSARFGEFLDSGRLPQHRSALHSNRAFMVAAGPGVPAGGRLNGGHVLDLAPTILTLLGRPSPAHLAGAALPGLGAGVSA